MEAHAFLQYKKCLSAESEGADVEFCNRISVHSQYLTAADCNEDAAVFDIDAHGLNA